MINTLARYEPLQELEEIQNRLSSFFGRSPGRRRNGHGDLALADWAPTADISEDENEYVIKAELPELKKEDVKVTAEAGTLTIMGERRFEKEEKGKRYHRVERAYGTFARSFTLPNIVDTTSIKAEFKDGVLRVTMPKREEAKPKQISIQVSK